MRFVLRVATIISLTLPAWADDPSSSVEFHQLKPIMRDGSVKVGFSVKNRTDELLKSIYVECAALDGAGDVTDTGIENVSNLHAGEISHGFVSMIETSRVQGVRLNCRVSDVHR